MAGASRGWARLTSLRARPSARPVAKCGKCDSRTRVGLPGGVCHPGFGRLPGSIVQRGSCCARFLCRRFIGAFRLSQARFRTIVCVDERRASLHVRKRWTRALGAVVGNRLEGALVGWDRVC